MKGLKAEKGITLVALIITIIVMLILVGVTINLVINGGLFEKAREGAQKTQERISYEEIVTSVDFDNNGYIIIPTTYANVKALMQKENKTFELLEPASENEIDDETEEITIKVLDMYTYTITKDEVVSLNE